MTRSFNSTSRLAATDSEDIPNLDDSVTNIKSPQRFGDTILAMLSELKIYFPKAMRQITLLGACKTAVFSDIGEDFEPLNDEYSLIGCYLNDRLRT